MMQPPGTITMTPADLDKVKAAARREAMEETAKLRAALSALAPICWRINDETVRSEGDRYYLASTNDWHDLHDALHKHADTIRSVAT